MGQDFLERITALIEANYSDDQFGVSELAREAGMSRSNLLRKIKGETNLSASQFIRKIRLERAMDLIKGSSLTVSEIAFKAGFGSTSYFIKCFRDHYGYPPGEAGKSSGQNTASGPSDQSHQLVAIMFTDIQGYTALMQNDESKAVAFRQKHREIFNRTTKKYYGKILQYFGDGTLSTFSSAIDAVHCSIEMQLAFLKEPAIPVRIGIHTGDIITREDDIIGDGVNVASRIESVAAPGSVCISAKVYDEIKNQTGIYATSLGSYELKNVQKPIEIYGLTNPGLIVTSAPGQKTAKSELQTGGLPLKRRDLQWIFIVLAAFLLGFFLYQTDFFGIASSSDSVLNDHSRKSIAVLPFVNNSPDSSNVYIVNGLMEATLNNLQKIKNLRVISRTSVEKFRAQPMTIPEIAEELQVQYLVEGSGQKIGDQIALNIQLLNAERDEQLWSAQFIREVSDIFNLQIEIASQITNQIEVVITPDEEARINKLPTDNPRAYDLFLKGLDLLNRPNRAYLSEALSYFRQAIEEDDQFARAYAAIAITYYHLDEFREEKQYLKEINYFADQALFFDDQLPQGLIAKGLHYMANEEYNLAIPYLERTLEFNPNFGLAFIYLIDIYVNHLPNSEKYLEYALQGLKIAPGTYDSTTTSFMYLHIANAFIQTGFIEEAQQYINLSLSINPDNLYSEYTRAFILYAKYEDLEQTRDLLLHAFKKDTTRLDIMQELAKIYYFLNDFELAHRYYSRFVEIKEYLNLDIYSIENAKIAVTCDQLGMTEDANLFFKEYLDHIKTDQSIYQPLSQAAYHAYKGEIEPALELMKIFAVEEDFHYWTVLFMKQDPIMENLLNNSEFELIYDELENKFWTNHRRIRISLQEKGLL